MKLRNKKTGEITTRIDVSESGEKFWVLSKKPCMYDTLAELNEDWEDSKPAEPLIKDEKIRKAVRAWAECCHVQVVHHYLCDGNSCFIFTDEGGNDCSLDFTFRIDNLESNTDYAITELCGEGDK